MSDEEFSIDTTQERRPIVIEETVSFVDAELNNEARFLHQKLQNITQDGIAFGQQIATIGDRLWHRGIDSDEPGLKGDIDFFNVSGEQPAIVGFELEGIGVENYDSFTFDRLRRLIINTHNAGAIITISWHATNIVSGGDSFSLEPAVSQMLENGSHRDVFIRNLWRVSNFLNSLIDSDGNSIPVLFRPWHEMNGDFFFWGEGFRTTEEYKELFQDTVRFLSENFNVHNVLYVYSPNQVSDESEYLKNYPGDAYVDLLGIDVYDFNDGQYLEIANTNLEIVEEIAREKSKLYAFTETGLDRVESDDWFIERFYKLIRSKGITYALVWRNTSEDHFFIPYVGHPAEFDFKEFTEKDLMLFQEDIP